MHQIISGETRKESAIIIKDRKRINEFISNNKIKFDTFLSSDNCLYKDFTIANPVLNFINENSENKVDKILKNLLINEFYDCEKKYPYLGDLFLLLFHDVSIKKKYKSFLFSKKHKNSFIKNLKFDISKSISKIIFENGSLDYVVNISNFKSKEVIVEKKNSMSFEAMYDFDYFENINYKIKNYNFIIIEGLIDTVGEIHHLLYTASEDKQSYVVFCLGVNEEVKKTIIENNRRNITKVYPVCFASNEENINVLNDISVLHNGTEIISALKGQTISQEIRKKLCKGKEINFYRGGMNILPTSDNLKIEVHKRFLEKRINESQNETNSEILKKRYKKFQLKKLNIFLPEDVSRNIDQKREIQYVLRFLSCLGRNMCLVSFCNKKIYIPNVFLKFLENKLNASYKTFNNLNKLILLTESNKDAKKQ